MSRRKCCPPGCVFPCLECCFNGMKDGILLSLEDSTLTTGESSTCQCCESFATEILIPPPTTPYATCIFECSSLDFCGDESDCPYYIRIQPDDFGGQIVWWAWLVLGDAAGEYMSEPIEPTEDPMDLDCMWGAGEDGRVPLSLRWSSGSLDCEGALPPTIYMSTAEGDPCENTGRKTAPEGTSCGGACDGEPWEFFFATFDLIECTDLLCTPCGSCVQLHSILLQFTEEIAGICIYDGSVVIAGVTWTSQAMIYVADGTGQISITLAGCGFAGHWTGVFSTGSTSCYNIFDSVLTLEDQTPEGCEAAGVNSCHIW